LILRIQKISSYGYASRTKLPRFPLYGLRIYFFFVPIHNIIAKNYHYNTFIIYILYIILIGLPHQIYHMTQILMYGLFRGVTYYIEHSLVSHHNVYIIWKEYSSVAAKQSIAINWSISDDFKNDLPIC